MTQVLGKESQGPIFEIVSTSIYDQEDERKHVIYTLQVRHVRAGEDLAPSVIERRYTHFLNLYNALVKEQPELMSGVCFPPKVYFGNFDNTLISTRSAAFEIFLSHVLDDSKLRSSKALVWFLQDVELKKARTLMDKRDFPEALPILENSFHLLSKVCTDRSSAVLLALCRLLGCSVEVPGLPNAAKWVELALQRFEGVSDSDLLELYAPLLITCIKVWNCQDTNTTLVEQRLSDLRRRGFKMGEGSLLEEVERVDRLYFHQFQI